MGQGVFQRPLAAISCCRAVTMARISASGSGWSGGEQHAGFRGLERGAVDPGDDAAGMGIKPKVAGEGGVAHHHLALGAGRAKAGHRVGQTFDMIGQEPGQRGAQICQGSFKGRGRAAI